MLACYSISMAYVALLRGINVGGNSKVSMADLKELFAELGFENISTYINSGNVVFTAPRKASVATMTEQIEAAITKRTNLRVKVLVKDAKTIYEIQHAVSPDWVNNSDMKCGVMFLWPEYDSPDVIKNLTLNSGIDDCFYIDGALVWKVDRPNITRSGMLKIIGTPLYKHMTIRNINTVRKLASILKETEAK